MDADAKTMDVETQTTITDADAIIPFYGLSSCFAASAMAMAVADAETVLAAITAVS